MTMGAPGSSAVASFGGNAPSVYGPGHPLSDASERKRVAGDTVHAVGMMGAMLAGLFPAACAAPPREVADLVTLPEPAPPDPAASSS